MHVVTLIHGTGARNAPWTSEGSNLRTRLEERLRPEPVIFNCFCWSGRNSVRARETAAADLRASLCKLIEEYPDARHSIIAHSHGGNIALRALDGKFELRKRVPLVVTLATPFIVASVRDTTKLRFAFSLPIKLVMWMMLLASPVGIIQLIAERSSIMLLVMFGQALLAGVLCGLLYAGKRLTNEFESQAEEQASFWRLSPVLDLKLLVIRAAADEASLALNFLPFAIFAGNVIWGSPVNLIQKIGVVLKCIEAWFERNRERYFLVTGSLGLGLSIFYITSMRPMHWDSVLWITLAFAIGTPLAIIAFVALLQFSLISGTGALAILACILFSPVWLLTVLATMPFGFFDLFESPFLRVTVEAAPPGAAQIVQLPPHHVSGLMHSSPYEDPDSIDATALWLSGRLNPHDE